MKLNLWNGWEQEVKYVDGEQVVRYLKDGKLSTKEEYEKSKSKPGVKVINPEVIADNYDTLKEVTHEFDHKTGTLLVHLETLRNINSELGTISEDVRNAEFKNYAYLLNDIDHKIHLLADLLHYTLEDFSETYEHTRMIKESYFDLLIRGDGESND